ncbi:TetR/AcrR family transcriptional regulator [Fundidesulfovibrio soli]|uniref:TetR/AcrR family transcriptional regulator n=1 Tax=Fundidesulfovibrio soli TaxID=2922716 RepID=UPI001FAFE576|nr:TetR/AcrR family transcriptional regulator [Fundidesulfovibrio soli]
MARRSDHTREQLTELVLGEAQRLVEAEGFKALTARRVAEAVGYSPGTLYNHFKNLDDLVVQVNARTLELLDGELAGAAPTGDPQADALALALAYFAFVERHPRLWELLFEYRLGQGSELPRWFTGRIEAILARMARVLAPLFAPGDTAGVEEAVQVLWASLHGIGSLATSGKLEVVTARSAAQLARSLVVHYVGGLGAARSGE